MLRRKRTQRSRRSGGVPVDDFARIRAMSLYYSIEDLDRRRVIPAAIWERLMGKPEGGVQ